MRTQARDTPPAHVPSGASAGNMAWLVLAIILARAAASFTE